MKWWNELPYFGVVLMRCGEWWASLPCGCCPTLTWLTILSVSWLFTGCWMVLVHHLVALCFFARAFLSVPPKYFHLVKHIGPVVFSLDLVFLLYFTLSWHWVIPSPNLFITLYVTAAANSFVRLFGFSITSLPFVASEVMVSLISLFLSSGRSIFCHPCSGSLNHPGIVFIWIKGLMLALSNRMSCLDFSHSG